MAGSQAAVTATNATAAATSATANVDSDVRFDGVEKHFGATVALHRLDLSIARGSFFSLLGPSGCGKTTTLRLIAGFEQPSRGRIHIHGRDVTGLPAHKRNFGMVFQSFALFPHMTVAENVAFGLKMRNVKRDAARKKVDNALELVALGPFGARLPSQLSGGQQQRVALARAIVFEPDVLLLDESLSALDKLLREQMQVELRQLQKRLGMTTVFVTHDQEEALTMSDRIAVMKDGRVLQTGAPRDIYERPADAFVAGFLGASNILPATLAARDGDTWIVDIAGHRMSVDAPAHANGAAPTPGSTVQIALRPEKIRIDPAGQMSARISEIVYRGAQTHVYLDMHGIALATHVANSSAAALARALAPGSEVQLAWDRDSMVALA